MKKTFLALLMVFYASQSYSQISAIVDLQAAQELGVKLQNQSSEFNVGFASLSESQEQQLQEWSHEHGRCGAYEYVGEAKNRISSFQSLVAEFEVQAAKNLSYQASPMNLASLNWTQSIEDAINQVSTEKLKEWVTWLSSFPSRYCRLTNPNAHVDELTNKLKTMAAGTSLPVIVEKINHESIEQKSIRVRITGKTRPNEVIVLGAHLDSITFSDRTQAPGADDNASGSSNLIEAYRVLLTQPQPERSIEFYWYAAEEIGLRGSGEIAEDNKRRNVDVVAVLQLDMTLYPGDGEMVIGNFTDYTSAWLQDYLKAIATKYLKVRLIESQCGYGCSDHASWYRQGYSTLFPFEASFRGANRWIHSIEDKDRGELNYKHSAEFSKIALIMALDLGNSKERGP